MFKIFDQPWSLLAVAGVILLIMLIIRSILPEKRRWWQLAVPIVIAGGTFALDFLVQTDPEQITAVVNKGVKAVEEENPDAIESIISENYNDSHHTTKAYLMNYCKMVLSQPVVEKNVPTILSMEISPSGTTATVVLTVRIMFDKRSYVYDYKTAMMAKLTLSLQKEKDKGWLINRAELLEIDRQPMNWGGLKQLE